MTTIHHATSYLTFKLGDELFAIDVARVREVLDLSEITRVPTAPPYMRGVVNVRGSAVPVVDLRLKFGLPSTPDTVHTRIVVLELELDGELTVVGGLADSVHEVLEIDPDQIREPPRIAMRWRADMIHGLGRKGDQFIIVLDIARVFAADHGLFAGAPAADAGAPEAIAPPSGPEATAEPAAP
ncbi:MAG TPA: chemotaxis protein CheW [Kofleriaceae bacterium]|nr:chemotaxis protein CheW [Kofleriaceae bacterium]